MKELRNKLITLSAYMNKNSQHLSAVWHLAKITNVLIFLLKLLEKYVTNYFSNASFYAYLTTMYKAFSGRDGDGNSITQISYIISAMFLGLCACVVYYLTAENNILTRVRKSYWVLLISYYPIFVLLIIELAYSMLILYLVECYRSQGQYSVFFHICTALTLALLLIVTFFNYNKRIFNTFYPLVSILFYMMEPIQANLSVIVPSLIFIYSEKLLIDRCSYIFSILTCIFNIVQQLDQYKNLLNLIYLAIVLLLVGLVMVVKDSQKCDVSNEMETNNFLMKCIRKLDKNQVASLGSRDLLKMQAIFRKFYQKYYVEIQQDVEFPTNKPISQLEFDQLFKLIDLKLQLTSSKSPNKLEYTKQYLLFRIENLYRIFDTISQISQFMDYGNKNNRSSYQQQYSRKYVELAVLQEFLSKQSESAKIEEIKDLTQIQQLFIDESVKLMVAVSQFWDQINTDVLIEEMIEENFYQIVVGVERVRKLLDQLKAGYKATWQTKLFDMISKLAYPDNQEFAPFQAQFQLFDKIKQETLFYFVLRNQNIVQISSTLLKMIDSTKYQIIGSHSSRIIPEEIIGSIKERQISTIKPADASNMIPIICDSFFIKIYEFSVKLQPRVDSGIEFFYFLKNIEKQQKRAYILLNSFNLSIHYISKQFVDILGLKSTPVQNKISKNALFLNNIVPEIDQNSIVLELKQKNVLKCEFSTHNLISQSQYRSGESRKFNGILTLQNDFGHYLLVSMQVISFGGEIPNSRFFKSKRNILFKVLIENNPSLQIPSTKSSQDIFRPKNLKNRSNRTKSMDSKYEDHTQNIYCPIKNPYKQKIQEKRHQMSQQNVCTKINYTNCAIILSILLIIALVLISILLMYYCGQQNNSIGKVIQAFNKAVRHTSCLIHGTYQVYTQYVLSTNRQAIDNHIQMFDQHASVNQYLQIQYKQIHKALSQFQEAFTGFYNRKVFSDVPYKIVHNYFTIQTYFSKTNLMEYAYNLKMASQKIRLQYQESENLNVSFNNVTQNEDHPLEFLFNNYLTISRIQAPFDSIPDLLEAYSTELNQVVVFIGVICGFAAIVFYFVVYTVKKNLETIKAVFQIFRFIDKNQVENRFSQIGQGMKIFSQNIPKDSLKKMADLNKMKESVMVVYSSKVRASKKNIQMFSLQQQKQEEEFVKKKFVLSNKNLPYFSALSKLKRYSAFVLLFFGAIGGFFLKMQVDLRQDKINLRYYCQIEGLIWKQLRISTDMFHYNIMINSFKFVTAPAQIRQKKSVVDKFRSGEFKSSFSQFYHQQSATLKENLCQVPINEVYLNNFIKCQDIGLGILQKGYIQTSQYYDSKREKLKQNAVNLIQIYEPQKYMDLLIHIYVRQKLIHQLKQYRVSIDQNRQRLQQKYDRNMMGFGVGLTVLGIAFVTYLVNGFVPILMRIRKTGIGYFQILPKEVLAKIHISAYISENNLLNRVTLM